MKRLFWDFDGTLVDVRRRLYILFCELTGADLKFDLYWELKRSGFRQSQMLKYVNSDILPDIFLQGWLKNVERLDLLKYDVLQPGVKDLLGELNAFGYVMYIVTNRQLKGNLEKQLAWLGIAEYFSQSIVTGQRCSKAEAVRVVGLEEVGGIFVGDSYEDMEAAAELGFAGVFVGDGFTPNMEGLRFLGNVASVSDVRGILERENGLF